MKKIMKKILNFVLITLIMGISTILGFSQTTSLVSGNQIQVFYGGWAEESSWEVVYLLDSPDTIYLGVGAVGEDYMFGYNGVVDMMPGEYEFKAYDSYGDGWIGSAGDGWFNVTPTVGVGTDTVQFSNITGSNFGDHVMVVPFTVYSLLPYDVGISSVMLPEDGNLSTSEYLSVEIKNYGVDNLDVGDVNVSIYSHYHQSYIYESNSMILGQGETEVVNFTTPLDMSDVGEYIFTIYADVAGDGYDDNNMMTSEVHNESYVTIPWVEDFNNCVWDGWTNGGSAYQYSAQSWECYMGSAARANFFYTPSGDIVMTSPAIYLSGNSILSFDWSSAFNSDYLNDALVVNISTDNGTSWETIWDASGVDLVSEDGAENKVAGSYKTESIDLFDYTGEIVFIQFYGVAGHGPDLFIDNVSIDLRYDNNISILGVNKMDDCDLVEQQFEFVVKNNGNDTVYNYTLEYEVDGVNYIEERTDIIPPSGEAVNILSDLTFDITSFSDTELDIVVDIHYLNDSDLGDNSLFEVLEYNKKIDVFPFYESFESGESDYWMKGTNRHSEVYVQQANNPTLYGDNIGTYLIMTGDNQYKHLWMGDSYDEAFGSEHQISEYKTCLIDASSLTNVEFLFDMKQFYKYHNYYTWLRVLLNDEIVISDVNGNLYHQPNSSYVDDVIEVKYDLTMYKDQPFTLTIQAVNKFGQVASPGNVTMIDNIIIREAPQVVQSIELMEQWNIMSTYVSPQNPNVERIFEPVINELVIVKNVEGNVYWPSFGYNGIGNINNIEGYQIKMFANATLDVYGDSIMPENTPINIDDGWSIIPYLRETPASIEALFGDDVNNIVIISDEMGNPFWPQFGVDNIQNMEAGEGYKLLSTDQFTYTYPANGDSVVTVNAKSSICEPYHYGQVERTGNNMFLSIVDERIKYGDEIGIYTNGNLVGSGVAKDGVVVVTIWGNDTQVDENKNSNDGDMYIVELYSHRDGSVHILENLEFEIGSDVFVPNSIAVIKDFDIDRGFETELLQNYPNPTVETTTIEFISGFDGLVTIDLYDATGKHIKTILNGECDLGVNKIKLDVSDLRSGNYYYVMRTANNEKFMKKMTII